jgi:UDP-glucose:(heptosyl)LPS alpha-1,3-glucosyltransferase
VRLAIVRRRYAPFGGAERFIDTTMQAIAAEGIDLSIISESWSGTGRGKIKHITVTPRGLTRSGRFASFQREVGRVVDANKFDLVQTHERLLTADIFRAGDGVHAAWLARLAGKYGGVRGMLRRVQPIHKLIVETERKMARETGMLFVANSDLVAREIADWLDVPARRIRVLENGVDTAKFHTPSPAERAAARASFGLDADSPVVAFVGSGFQRKGAFELVEALGLPPFQHVHALIAGHDRELSLLRRVAKGLGIVKRVQIFGGIADPLPVYHAADVFALPSLYDPMPNAALEALACGLPLLVTPDTGIADAVRSSGAGLIVNRNADDVAAGLMTILARPLEMANAARALAPRFDHSFATARWLALYRELA